MNVEEAYQRARDLLGPPPAPPELRDVPDASTGGLGGVLGGKGESGQHVPIEQDPNNSLLAQMYQAELLAYNERLDKCVERLLK